MHLSNKNWFRDRDGNLVETFFGYNLAYNIIAYKNLRILGHYKTDNSNNPNAWFNCF